MTKKTDVIFEAIAWRKIIALVQNYNTEVGWHGVVSRIWGRDGNPFYIVKDIEVYPQTVTGGTVETNQSEYESWLYNHTDKEFKEIRLHGHSHVNISVDPSATDMEFYKGIIEQTGEKDYYLFMIINKRYEVDLITVNNHEISDANIIINDKSFNVIEKFLDESKNMVKERVSKNHCVDIVDLYLQEGEFYGLE